MASRNAQVQSAQFSVNWKMKWSEFDSISSSGPIRKFFNTSCNNIPLHWIAVLVLNSSSKMFSLCYQEGPIEKLMDFKYTISIVKSDQSIDTMGPWHGCDGLLGSGLEAIPFGLCKFADKDPAAFRAKYGLKESDPLVIWITLKIPLSVFSYSPSASPPVAPQKWTADLFASIQDPEKLVFSKAKLISHDGDEFYCEKVIGYQSEPLKAMFCYPPPPGKPDNEYEFDIGGTSLKALIQFLYTGQADLGNMTTTDLIELADAAEMYHLKPLKQACTVVLWKQVVDNPSSSAAILRFAYLHDDLKDLKHRAMDVLAEIYETSDVFGGGDQGARLRDEFLLFVTRRVTKDKI